jgi:hypothetical protein
MQVVFLKVGYTLARWKILCLEGKKKQARKSYGSSGTPGSTSSSVDVVGTWMREEGGVLQKLVVSKTDATWLGPWEVS